MRSDIAVRYSQSMCKVVNQSGVKHIYLSISSSRTTPIFVESTALFCLKKFHCAKCLWSFWDSTVAHWVALL